MVPELRRQIDGEAATFRSGFLQRMVDQGSIEPTDTEVQSLCKFVDLLVSAGVPRLAVWRGIFHLNMRAAEQQLGPEDMIEVLADVMEMPVGPEKNGSTAHLIS